MAERRPRFNVRAAAHAFAMRHSAPLSSSPKFILAILNPSAGSFRLGVRSFILRADGWPLHRQRRQVGAGAAGGGQPPQIRPEPPLHPSGSTPAHAKD